MQDTVQKRQYANNHISIDSVVLGFDEQQLKVLLVPQQVNMDGKIIVYRKFPGNIIYQDEDMEEAAHRTLEELTGIHGVSMYQFKTYGSRNRTSKPKDLIWLQQTLNIKVERIVTTAYLSFVKLDANIVRSTKKYAVTWVPVNDIEELAFDHNTILNDALAYFRKLVDYCPIIMFELLPRKFTILQLRTLYEFVHQREMDVRNFQKKMAQMEYVVPMDEHEEGVRHRAARFYKFDKVIYNRTRR